MSPLPFRKDLPPHTRLILARDDLLATFGARSEDGYRISAEWGEPRPEGWYEPTFSLHFDDDLRKATVERIAKAIDKAAYKLDNRRYGPRILEVGEIRAILDAEVAR